VQQRPGQWRLRWGGGLRDAVLVCLHQVNPHWESLAWLCAACAVAPCSWSEIEARHRQRALIVDASSSTAATAQAPCSCAAAQNVTQTAVQGPYIIATEA
jgi:hypothetical protein